MQYPPNASESCSRRSVKYIVIGSPFFPTPFILLALVSKIQQTQNDLFDGGGFGDEVLIFVFEQLYLSFLAKQALSALRFVLHDAKRFSIHGATMNRESVSA